MCGKIGYYPFFLLVTHLYLCSSYKFIIFDLINKLSYFASFLTILNISISIGNFDLWYVLANFISCAFFIKFMLSIKHTIFISSFVLFVLVYYLLFLQDLLYIFSSLVVYVLVSTGIVFQLMSSLSTRS